MIQFHRTGEFDRWLKSLKDTIGKARVLARIRSSEFGNFGDSKPVGDGVLEMRIHFGPGYRVYYTRKGDVVYLLLIGGTKATQAGDIAKAKEIARDIKDEF